MVKGARREHLFVETDGQIYLVRQGRVWRFPRASEKLPFRAAESGRMDFGDDLVRRMKPSLTYHPEEWFNRDDLFSRSDVDGLVKKAVYMTMPRLVAEAALARGHDVLMVRAKRGFSRGYWNLPGGFLDFGEPPEVAVEREVEEEIGADITLDGLLGVYHSGFPGKPTYTMGFVYRGHTDATTFRLKPDEIEAAEWFPVHRGLLLTRNPFVRWGLVDLFKGFETPPFDVVRHGLLTRDREARSGPVVFLDRDGVINRGRAGYVRTPDQFEFLDGAPEAIARLNRGGYRVAIVSNQDAVGWKLIPKRQLSRIHDKMVSGLDAAGARVEEIYVCPHHVLADCPCRKPRPGLLLAAARDLDVNPREAWMAGDKPSDIEAGRAFGARTVFVGDAKRRKRFSRDLQDLRPDATATDLRAAASAILGRG
ncbi:MAG: HAD-IIIA family hydrolase [Methanobacteriota archaeon]|nr:MAG: HAD-IIIA family hydrolase [Euryarchaeota archaeon]